MTEGEWAEYQRRLALREQRRNDVRAAAGWDREPSSTWAADSEETYMTAIHKMRKVFSNAHT
jgi:hypothetical protein